MSQVASQQRVTHQVVSVTSSSRPLAHALLLWMVKVIIIATLVMLALVVLAAWRPDVVMSLMELM